MTHERTKATAIPPEVKRKVWHRDGECCIFCGRGVPDYCANAHVVNRSQGGKGVEQNIVTACYECHTELDNGAEGAWLRQEAKDYMRSIYQNWSEDQVKYEKGVSQ